MRCKIGKRGGNFLLLDTNNNPLPTQISITIKDGVGCVAEATVTLEIDLSEIIEL